ncbi:hypothetical protein PIB30_116688 [Stylosanthes scabra]|uniref:Transmembrane protein n=1 Tax=Stylosanthes scabra TaxID=79078 RepID=A0ABU6Q5A6_9FABA|nr:hypothetical protein [Stylosanthes scabra]
MTNQHGVSHAPAIILIIIASIIIYSTIAATPLNNKKQESTMKPRKYRWCPKYKDAFNVAKCKERCSKEYENDERREKRCKDYCLELKECIGRCQASFADEQLRNQCYKSCKIRPRPRRRLWLKIIN